MLTRNVDICCKTGFWSRGSSSAVFSCSDHLVINMHFLLLKQQGHINMTFVRQNISFSKISQSHLPFHIYTFPFSSSFITLIPSNLPASLYLSLPLTIYTTISVKYCLHTISVTLQSFKITGCPQVCSLNDI